YVASETSPSSHPAADARVAAAELQAALREAVDALPTRCRQVFELSRVQGLKYGEIAQQLGVSVKAVEAQMGRALRTLREWLVPPGAEPGVVLYLHGGGYVSCSAATHRPITTTIARLTGRRVLAVDYRRAPEHRFPAALDDVEAAYRWLLDSGVPARSIAL